jgi:deoxyuridine 5'-triphosphate nucleotidohydrolase
MKLEFIKTGDVKTPSKAHITDAGLDFFVPNDFEPLILWPGEDVRIDSYIKIDVPAGWSLVFFNKSGIATNMKLIVGAQVIDSGYRGNVHIHVFNAGVEPVKIMPGQKIVQGLLLQVPTVELIETTTFSADPSSERGAGGFGSTGVQ